MEKNQDYLRGDGKLPIIAIEAENLAEATYKSIIACHDYGARIETPKHHEGGSLGYDADMIIRVNNPDSDPKIFSPGIHDDQIGVMIYILEVTHGIHNHWKKDPNNPHDTRWGYTYNERFVDQLPFIFERIKKDWDDKRRISGRDYQFTIWRPGEDIILAQDDPPCWQRGHLRFLVNEKGEIVLNYITDWRSRDLYKAWNENNIAQVELFKLFTKKISDLLQTPVKMGVYIDRSSSLHLYGMYINRDNLESKIEKFKAVPYNKKSIDLNKYLGDTIELKRIIGAQEDAESKGKGIKPNLQRLKELGYDLNTFEYPKEWDSWPKSWDAKPDITKLARVIV